MINILNLHTSPQIIEALNALDTTAFQVVSALSSTQEVTQDLVLCSIEQYKKNTAQIQNVTTSGIIFYDEKNTSYDKLYKTALEAKAINVISATDLVRLETILKEGYQKILSLRSKKLTTGKTIGVISLKGGVGTSFLAYHLSSYLSQLTQNTPLLVDTSIPFGSSKALLNIDTEKSWGVLQPLLQKKDELTSQRFRSQIVTSSFGFDLLISPQSLRQSALTPKEMSSLISRAREHYAVSVFDCDHSFARDYAKYSELFDLVLLVTTLDSQSLLQTFQVVQELKNSSIDKGNLRVLINMVEPQYDEPIAKEVRKKLGNIVIGSIDFDQEAVKHFQRQFTLITENTLLLTQQFQKITRDVFYLLSNN